MRHHELSFLGFHSTRPKTAVVGGLLFFAPPRGKSIAPNRGCPRRNANIIAKRANPRNGEFWQIARRRGIYCRLERRLGTTFARRVAGRGMFSRVERVDRVEI